MFWELFVWRIAGNSITYFVATGTYVPQMCQFKHGTFDHGDMIPDQDICMNAFACIAGHAYHVMSCNISQHGLA